MKVHEENYFHLNPDSANMNPVLRHEKHGEKASFDFEALKPGPEAPKVIIICHAPSESGVDIWRARFLRDEICRLGHTVSIESSIDGFSKDFHGNLAGVKTIVWIRPPLDLPDIQKIIADAKRLRKRQVFDLDALLFPAYAQFSGAVKSGVNSYDDSYRAMFHECALLNEIDLALVSTRFIQKEASRLFGVPAVIRENVLPSKYIRPGKRVINREHFNIIYSSGSISNDYDLSTVIPELVSFMLRRADAKMIFWGKTDNGFTVMRRLFGDRVAFHPCVAFENMSDVYAQADLSLVPLDKNPFNNAKSNIKFIEAAAAGVPVLARDCDEFVRTITDGETGFIYKEGEFLEKLERIYAMPCVGLAKIGEAARQYTLKNFTVESGVNDKAVLAMLGDENAA